jgi:hypothetical protein
VGGEEYHTFIRRHGKSHFKREVHIEGLFMMVEGIVEQMREYVHNEEDWCGGDGISKGLERWQDASWKQEEGNQAHDHHHLGSWEHEESKKLTISKEPQQEEKEKEKEKEEVNQEHPKRGIQGQWVWYG